VIADRDHVMHPAVMETAKTINRDLAEVSPVVVNQLSEVELVHGYVASWFGCGSARRSHPAESDCKYPMANKSRNARVAIRSAAVKCARGKARPPFSQPAIVIES